MTNQRREFLKKFVVFITTVCTIKSQYVFGKSLTESLALKQSTKNADIIDSNKIEIKLPKIAEKGSAVPITVTSRLENIQSIAILVEKNRNPLVATFKLSAELEAFVSARFVMAETSNVIVLVETPEGIYRAKEQVKISIGGCGT
jgi:sulfur-oxidizing protein SoxY